MSLRSLESGIKSPESVRALQREILFRFEIRPAQVSERVLTMRFANLILGVSKSSPFGAQGTFHAAGAWDAMRRAPSPFGSPISNPQNRPFLFYAAESQFISMCTSKDQQVTRTTHDSRTNHSHEHRASNGATTLNSRGRRRRPQAAPKRCLRIARFYFRRPNRKLASVAWPALGAAAAARRVPSAEDSDTESQESPWEGDIIKRECIYIYIYIDIYIYIYMCVCGCVCVCVCVFGYGVTAKPLGR